MDRKPISSLWEWGYRDALVDSVEPLRMMPLDSLSLEYRDGYSCGMTCESDKRKMPPLGASWEAQDRAACIMAVEAFTCDWCKLRFDDWQDRAPDCSPSLHMECKEHLDSIDKAADARNIAEDAALDAYMEEHYSPNRMEASK